MLNHHADAARELQVVEDECDLHAQSPALWMAEGAWSASRASQSDVCGDIATSASIVSLPMNRPPSGEMAIGSVEPSIDNSGARAPTEPSQALSDRPWRPKSPDAARSRVALIGPAELLDRCAPCGGRLSFVCEQFASKPGDDAGRALAEAVAFAGDFAVVLDPGAFTAETLEELPGITVGILPELPTAREQTRSCAALDRLVCVDPALTGKPVGDVEIWRSVPPPVSDAFFEVGRALHRRPRAMSIGASTPHREAMLMPAKHHHDLLQVIHGVGGSLLSELLSEYDVGIYVGRNDGGDFEWQVGLHLAAGHLLFSEPLRPAHGLETNIDYVKFDSPEDLVAMLDRLASFPEMHERTRIRGHFKAEYFRASQIFARLIHDARLDVAAFGRRRAPSS